MKAKSLAAAAIVAVFAGGCSSSSEKISGAYVSPLQYQSFGCDQIGDEMRRVGRRLAEVAGVQDSEAEGDAWAMGVGLVLFWPALFFLADGGDRAQEVARLKGEVEALEQAAIRKDCKGLLERIEREKKAAQARAKAKTKSGEDGIDPGGEN